MKAIILALADFADSKFKYQLEWALAHLKKQKMSRL